MKTGGMRLEGVYSRSHVIPNQPAGRAPRRGPLQARRAAEWATAGSGLARHHDIPAIARSSPAVLLAHPATAPDDPGRSGGVMLSHHAPPVVAEQFDMITSQVYSLTDPLRSYELIAELSFDRAQA